MNRIVDASMIYDQMRMEKGYRRLNDEQIIIKLSIRAIPYLSPRDIQWDDPFGTVEMIIDKSAQVVDCPFCAGRMYDRVALLFFCASCAMEENDYHSMEVIRPDDLEAIKTMLSPLPKQERNWSPES